MNAQTFLENFGHIANAPDGINKIRKCIINLAVAGNLATNNTEESPVCLPLKEPKDGRHPTNWRFGRLGAALIFTYGKNLPAKKRSETGEYPVYGSNGIVGTHNTFLTQEPVIVVGRKGSAGALNISNVPSWTTDVAYYVAPPSDLDIRFTYYLLTSLDLPDLGKGIKPGLSRKEVYKIPIAIPPLTEQKRIVAKVDELMALCDKLEGQQQEQQLVFPVLSRASHARFAETPSPANLKAIFNEVGTVSSEDLRKTILSLATYGKLVPQANDDKPANLLLAQIARQRDSVLSGGYPNESEARTQKKKQRGQKLPSSLPELPSGWAWATLMQASLLVVDCHNKTAPYVSNGIRLLRTTNIRNGQLNLKEPKFVTETAYEKWSARCRPEPGDILITREAPMGEVCIIPEGMKICMGQRMMLIRLCPDTINQKFLLYSLMEPGLMDRVQDKPIGATVKHLRVGGVETLLVPVAPVAEQHRIVAKVDQLMALVTKLEEQQNKKNKVAEAFAQAAVTTITGTQVKEPEKMKAPKTELVTKLQVESKPRPADKSPLANLIAKHNGELSAKALWLQSGLEIDAFYQQLKTEMASGWISEPEKAYMKEQEAS